MTRYAHCARGEHSEGYRSEQGGGNLQAYLAGGQVDPNGMLWIP